MNSSPINPLYCHICAFCVHIFITTAGVSIHMIINQSLFNLNNHNIFRCNERVEIFNLIALIIWISVTIEIIFTRFANKSKVPTFTCLIGFFCLLSFIIILSLPKSIIFDETYFILGNPPIIFKNPDSSYHDGTSGFDYILTLLPDSTNINETTLKDPNSSLIDLEDLKDICYNAYLTFVYNHKQPIFHLNVNSELQTQCLAISKYISWDKYLVNFYGSAAFVFYFIYYLLGKWYPLDPSPSSSDNNAKDGSSL
jgi:hypothetical protein